MPSQGDPRQGSSEAWSTFSALGLKEAAGWLAPTLSSALRTLALLPSVSPVPCVGARPRPLQPGRWPGCCSQTRPGPQVSAAQSSPATCWPPAVVTLGEAVLVGPAWPAFQALSGIVNHFSASGAPCSGHAPHAADLTLPPEAPQAGP